MPLRLAAGGRMQGFSVRLAWDPAVVEPMGMRSGGFAEGQGGLALSPGPGRVDAALLGRREPGLHRRRRSWPRSASAPCAPGDAALRIGAGARPRRAPTAAAGRRARRGRRRLTPRARRSCSRPAPNPFTAQRGAVVRARARRRRRTCDLRPQRPARAHAGAAAGSTPGVHRLAWDGLDDARSSWPRACTTCDSSQRTSAHTSRLVHLK